MKNLKEYNVQEMNAQEVKKIDGGSWRDFARGMGDCFQGSQGDGQHWSYYAGWALECMAGGGNFANGMGRHY